MQEVRGVYCPCLSLLMGSYHLQPQFETRSFYFLLVFCGCSRTFFTRPAPPSDRGIHYESRAVGESTYTLRPAKRVAH